MSDVWNTVTKSKNKKKVGMIQKHAQNCKTCGEKDHVFQNCPIKRFLKEGNLIVKKVHDIKVIPEVLQTKHFAESKLDPDKAMEVSKNRNQVSAKTGQKICQNDVFEKPKLDDSEVLIKYIVVNTIIPGFDQWRGKAIVASKTQLNIYRCKTEKGTDSWNRGRRSRESYAIFAGKAYNYHLITDFIKVENIIDIDEIDIIEE
jgi:hypothetical protein